MRTSPTLVVLGLLVAATTACGAPAPAPAAPPAPVLPSAPPPAPAPSTAELPSDVLDLDGWYLTLPTGEPGDPDSVYQPQLATYSSPSFHLNDARDGVVFRADVGGATTSGSRYPRSELREMQPGTVGDEDKASWSNEVGTHRLSVRQAVTAVPPVKPEVVTAQIHDSEDDVLEIRLEGERLVAAYDDGDSSVTIDPAYQLGTVYDLEIVAADRRITVLYNGAEKADLDISGSGWYFKSGSYVQSNPSRGDAPGAVGEVVLHGLRVTHSD